MGWPPEHPGAALDRLETRLLSHETPEADAALARKETEAKPGTIDANITLELTCIETGSSRRPWTRGVRSVR